MGTAKKKATQDAIAALKADHPLGEQLAARKKELVNAK